MSIQVSNNYSQIYYQQKLQGNNITYPAFRSNGQDTVEISTKKEKKKMSWWKKAGLGIAGTIAGLGLALAALYKHEKNTFNRLYKEKMTFVNLPELIEFKEAKTVEDGIKFAKDVLKVENVDESFTLDAINYANKGLVDVANANKGRLFMPKKLTFYDFSNETSESTRRAIAYVEPNIESKDFGMLAINKTFFEPKVLNEKLKEELFTENGERLFEFYGNDLTANWACNKCSMEPNKDVRNLIKDFYKNPNKMSINKKRDLLQTIWSARDNVRGEVKRCPMTALTKHKKYIEKNLHIKINLEDIRQKTTKEQQEYLENLLKKLYNKRRELTYEIKLASPLKTMYHEMGHLQDYAKNLKEIDKKDQLGLDLRSIKIRHFDNRWGGTTYDGYKELFEQKPEEFKKKYPDLYEFLTNEATQQITGKVSWYSQTSIGEFIAEVYAKMIKGEKIPDDVMALYKKYNGPMVPFS